MNIENYKLKDIIDGLNGLKSLTMPGKLALAVVELNSALINKYSKIQEARRNVMEALAEKDEDGIPKIIQSKGYYTYVFPSTEIEKECEEKLLEIDKTSLEYNFFDPKITKEDIVKLNCNPAQAEALLLFVK